MITTCADKDKRHWQHSSDNLAKSEGEMAVLVAHGIISCQGCTPVKFLLVAIYLLFVYQSFVGDPNQIVNSA